HTLPHRAPDLRESLGTEQQQRHEQQQNDLPRADVWHVLRVAVWREKWKGPLRMCLRPLRRHVRGVPQIGYYGATSCPPRPLSYAEKDVTKLAVLELKNLHVALEDGTEIVKGVDLSVSPDEVHAVMGPNGSGKSTLAYALMGHPAYEITEGELLLDGRNILEMEADARAER